MDLAVSESGGVLGGPGGGGSPATTTGTDPAEDAAEHDDHLSRMDDDKEDKISASYVMEINTSYALPQVKKEVSSPPLGSPHMGSPHCPRTGAPDINNCANDGQHHLNESSFQQRILQQQQLQQQLLLHQYQQQQQQLAEQHEKQLQHHIKLQQSLLYHQFQQEHQRLLEQQQNELQNHLKNYLEQQSVRAEEERVEKIRAEQERLEILKKKEKHEQSAVASSEVKQRLQEVLLQKKQRQAESGAPVGPGASNYRWLTSQRSLEKPNPPGISTTGSSTHPYRPGPPIHKYDDDYPLRKTVESGSTPDSGQSSPPNGLPTSRSSSGSTPIHEEGGGSPYGQALGTGTGSCTDLPLYSSPSLPNISLGRPPHSTQPDLSESLKLPMVSENVGPLPTSLSSHLGSLSGSGILHNTLPYYPSLSGMDGDGFTASGLSPLGLSRQQMVVAMETNLSPNSSSSAMAQYHSAHSPHMTEAQARLRSMQRPLGRTQSAPLPLGHPKLQGQAPTFLPHGHPGHQYDPKLAMEQHNLLKQQLRQTVLTRSVNKNHVENVAEETEAAVAQAIAHDKTPELIDLTEKRMEESEIMRQQRDRAMFLQQQRDLFAAKPPPQHSTTGSAFTPRSGSHIARPLSRALSSPLVTVTQGSQSPQEPINILKQGQTTGFAYDTLMLKHQCICGDNASHPENGGRLQSIYTRLQDTGLIHRCHRLRGRKATLEEIQSCHSEAHTLLFGTNPWNRQRLDMSKFQDLPIKSFVRLQCGGVGVDSDTTWNELHTSSAARMATGCVLELAFKVATGELRNGFALVRPPGHHAEHQQAMGFCFFNSVAVAARQLQQKLNVEKVLIIDWDVHHGNGTQGMFYDDPHILYISLHRYDDGSFFPGTGAPTEVGDGDGYGFNVNIAWSGGLNPALGDAEYMAAFRSVVMPIAKDFSPDVVLVSAGFDAADGHPSPLGGYKVSAACFAQMTKQLMQTARGKVVLALEGGYNQSSICDASEACVRALTGDEAPEISDAEKSRKPCQNAIDTIQNVIAIQSGHWPVVSRHASTVGLSIMEIKGNEEEQETVSAMASLRVDPNSQTQSPVASPGKPTESNDQEEPMEEEETAAGK